jgi:peptide/nickel transport system permease protein
VAAGVTRRHAPASALEAAAVSRRDRWAAAGRLAARRLLFVVPVTVLVSMAVFALAAASPYDPLAGYLGERYLTVGADQAAALREQLGLDRPWIVWWWDWIVAALHGDLGTSHLYGQPVTTVIGQRLPWTLLLAGIALVLAVGISLLVGVRAATRPGGLLDRTLVPLAYLLQGIPTFVLGLGAILLFALTWAILPAAGATDATAAVSVGQVAEHLVLPATVLGLSQVPWLLLHVRQSMLEALSADHVRTARARGLSDAVVVRRHALPGALLPFLSVIGVRLPELVVGATVIEVVFSWPGIAAATVASARAMDFALLAALTTVTTLLVLLGNLLADVAYTVADPRVSADDQ